MSKGRLYTLICIACLVGFCYLLYSYHHANTGAKGLCIIKNATGYPCPSCGTTRAILLLFKGRFIESFLMNPLGVLVALIMLVSPVWILTDIVTKRETFYTFYKKTEAAIATRKIAIVLTILILLNWIWNITKGV